MEIKQLIILFCGYGLKIYDIDDDLLNSLKRNDNDILGLESYKYDYELCRYYIKYKFEKLNERKNKDNLYTYFTCALDTDDEQFAYNEIFTNIIPNNSVKIE